MAKKQEKRTNDDLRNVTQTTKTEYHELLYNPWVNSGASEGKAVPVPLVAPVVLLLLQTR